MAAPPTKTIYDLDGRWSLNKGLSDNLDSVMRLQGLSWLSRKAVNAAQITTQITLAGRGPSATLTLANTANFNIKGTTEVRTLDWEWRDFKDYIWGAFQDRSRHVHKKNLAPTVSSGEWLESLQGDDATLIESEVRASDGAWTNRMLWGFKVFGSERFLIRHMEVRRGRESAHAVLVYDYCL
ncbi:hypothetical protein BDV95DRAFT_612001 [Massariosphaeria phaeospora]|uniref:Uncharacterized protein n=1 Tax=Massariosphaeria phaeospora TaxID=100035 RepID=A0A7C8I269_9PLEO|nr:hypothetical protein BDV95DRAFT_612001 [Massariosphaeria phaeospora]